MLPALLKTVQYSAREYLNKVAWMIQIRTMVVHTERVLLQPSFPRCTKASFIELAETLVLLESPDGDNMRSSATFQDESS